MNVSVKAPWHLWAVGIVSLLWNGYRGYNYIMAQSAEVDAASPPSEAMAYIIGLPIWVDAAWALGVWGAVLGSALLLFRSRWAVASFLISIVGLTTTTIYHRIVVDLPESLSGINFLILAWATILFAAWYAWSMRKNGVLR